MSGMEPALIAALVGGGMGGLGAAFGQSSDTKPFAGSRAEELMAKGVLGTENLAEIVSARFAEPISLAGTAVQPLPIYAGGGLPMPIGGLGQDPALSDPSLLTLGGLGDGGFLGTPGAGTGAGRNVPPRLPGDEVPTDPNIADEDINRDTPDPLRGSTTSLVQNSLQGGAMFGGGGGRNSSIDQAEGAVNLLEQIKLMPQPLPPPRRT